MNLKDLGFEQLLNIVKQLPDEKRTIVKEALKTKPSTKNNIQSNMFSQLLLGGPVMEEKRYKSFKANRKRFDLWRKK